MKFKLETTHRTSLVNCIFRHSIRCGLNTARIATNNKHCNIYQNEINLLSK